MENYLNAPFQSLITEKLTKTTPVKALEFNNRGKHTQVVVKWQDGKNYGFGYDNDISEETMLGLLYRVVLEYYKSKIDEHF